MILGDDSRARCAWSGNDPEYRRYHDEEWGVPLHGDQPLFEKISLEVFQSGLSWITILRKRPRFREVFHDFDCEAVSRFTEADIERLLADTGIIRHRTKILATIDNAHAALQLERSQGEGALDHLVWSFHEKAQADHRVGPDTIPTSTPASVGLSRALRAIGFRFIGPTTMYALLQSTGVVDDHVTGCFRARL
ncbi:3-methyladenine DNA glycosylase [Rathayibacter toxicus]|uniref:3-methyladenine DNA glycosylase n=1 Tax=Rathayibacter toxicus TaxID=145458 RepID=A0A0U1PVL7_9MICO|nr:3-methyladenine DNA glycosylase [Rathayibacter toxicus]KKM47010.1 3-methyladenine DNA glycosylase [Rathayibacter toxicus]